MIGLCYSDDDDDNNNNNIYVRGINICWEFLGLSLSRPMSSRQVKMLGCCCLLEVVSHLMLMAVERYNLEFPLDLLLPNHGL